MKERDETCFIPKTRSRILQLGEIVKNDRIRVQYHDLGFFEHKIGVPLQVPLSRLVRWMDEGIERGQHVHKSYKKGADSLCQRYFTFIFSHFHIYLFLYLNRKFVRYAEDF